MRLIDADALLADCIFSSPQFEKGMRKFIADAPTIDAVPVVHGEWVDEGKKVTWDELFPGCPSGSCECSICGDWLTASDEYPARGLYCPNCGAKMDGGKDDEADTL